MKVIYEDRDLGIYGCVKFDKEEILVKGDFKSSVILHFTV